MKGYFQLAVVIMISFSISLPAEAEGEDRWTNARMIGQGGDQYPMDETISFGPTGIGVAAWLQDFGGTNIDIWTNLYYPGEGWGIASRLTNIDSERAYEPFATYDGSGNPVLFWSQDDGTYLSIQCSFLSEGVWSNPQFIESAAGNAYHPKAVFHSSGKGFAVWHQAVGTIDNIMVCEFDPVSGWGTPRLLEQDDTGSAMDPGIVMDDSGNAIVVWIQNDGLNKNVRRAHYEAGIGWHDDESLETITGDAKNVRIAMNPSGTAVAAWVHEDASDKVYTKSYRPSYGWDNSVSVLVDHDYIEDLSVEIDDLGYCAASWYVMDGLTQNAYGCLYDPATGWGIPESLEDGINNAYNIDLEMDGSGNTAFVWVQKYNLWSRSHSRENGWSEPIQIEKRLEHAFDISITTSPDGTFTASWIQNDGYNYRVWESRLYLRDEISLSVSTPIQDSVSNVSRIPVQGVSDPGSVVDVNGILISVDADGSFNCTVGLVPGENTILIMARDGYGNSNWVSIEVVYNYPLAQEIAMISENLTSALVSLGSLINDVDSLRERIVALEGDITSLEENITRLDSILQRHRENITSILDRIVALEQLNGSVSDNDTVNDLREDLADLADELAMVQGDMIDLEAEIVDADDPSLREDLDMARSDIDAVKSSNGILLIIVILLSVLVLILLIFNLFSFFNRKNDKEQSKDME